MRQSAIAATLAPLFRVGACSLIGTSGLVFAPALAAVSIWVAKALGDDQAALGSIAETLSHIFGHLSGDAAHDVIASLHEPGNHDLERATAIAIQRALM